MYPPALLGIDSSGTASLLNSTFLPTCGSIASQYTDGLRRNVNNGMYLFWLRVAVTLYAAGCIAVVPAVLYTRERWRGACIHLAGLGFFFHFVSAVEMLNAAHRWLPAGAREIESMLG